MPDVKYLAKSSQCTRMSSVRNTISKGDTSNTRQRRGIVHPIFASKHATKDDKIPSVDRHKNSSESHKVVISAPYPKSIMPRNGIRDPHQSHTAATNENCGYYKQKISPQILNGLPESKVDPDQMLKNGKMRTSSSSTSATGERSSGDKDIPEKNKKSSVEQKRFYQRKLTGFSGITNRLFKLLRPPLQRRNSCPVLSISELKLDAKLNSTPGVKPPVQRGHSSANPNGDISSQQNRSCRLTKWISHSELLHSEISRQNITQEEVVTYNRTKRISLKDSSVTRSSLEPSGYIASQEIQSDLRDNEFSDKGYEPNALGSKNARDQKHPFVVEKTVIIVSENSTSYKSDGAFYSDRHAVSNYSNNIDQSVSMSNAIDEGADNSNCCISQRLGDSVEQVKVINSFPFQNSKPASCSDVKTVELEQRKRGDIKPLLGTSGEDFEVPKDGFRVNNSLDRSCQEVNVSYSNVNNLDTSRLCFENDSKNENFYKFPSEEKDAHIHTHRLILSNSPTLKSENGNELMVNKVGQCNVDKCVIQNINSYTNSELKADGEREIQSKNNVRSNSSREDEVAQDKSLARINQNISYEPIYAVVKKVPTEKKLAVLNRTGDDHTDRNVSAEAGTSSITGKYSNGIIFCNGSYVTNGIDESQLNLITSEVTNTNFNNKQLEIGYINVTTGHEGTLHQNAYASDGLATNFENSMTPNRKIFVQNRRDNIAQPQILSIICNPTNGKPLSELPSQTDQCQNANIRISIANGKQLKNDVWDFGECALNASVTNLQSCQINECYNVKLDAPEEVIVAGFHDFCHTMLSLEESLELHDTGTIKRNPGYKGDKAALSTETEETESENKNSAMLDKQCNIKSQELSTSLMRSQEESHNLNPDTPSTPISNEKDGSTDKLLEDIQNSKSLGKMSIKDPDVIDAIRTLDKSLMEISGETMESYVDIPSESNPTLRNASEETEEKLCPKSLNKIVKEDKIQCDNLIEELMLEDINKRVTNSPACPNTSQRRGIAVTITNTGAQQLSYERDINDFQSVGKTESSTNVENTENSDFWLSTKFSCTKKGLGSVSDVNSSNLDEISSDAYGSDICDSDDVTKKVNRIFDTKTDGFPLNESMTSDGSTVYPLQVSVDDNQSAVLQGAACNRTSPCSVDSGTSSHNQGYFVVVAIDFGTTYSGYAFSFTRDPDNIHMMKKWDGGDPGVFNQKTPTILLLSPEGSFHSFGYSARDYYHDLDEEEAKGWLYFEKFKMTLHHSEYLSLETEIAAANGQCMPAVTVFAHALRYFKDHALQELSDQSATRILNEDVRWVVTVPAIWKQPAKQFMRAAAYQAGIASPEFPEQLLIALEPEAASIYCRRIRLHQLVPDDTHIQRSSFQWQKDKDIDSETGSTISDKEFASFNMAGLGNEGSFSVGTRYMVVDCGGGTVDITVHELLDKQGTLKELQKASGGPYGSIGVDMEFEKLLCDIFGEDFIQQFKSKRPIGYVDLMIAFEARKRNANPYKTNPLNISLPFSFIDYYKKYKGSSVETTIKKSSHKNVKWSSQGMLRLEPSVMEGLFRRTVAKIRQHIENIISEKDMHIDHIFLVGGFAESLILQKEIKDAFSSTIKVIIPQGVSLAILKGAVLFGLDPTTINIRRLRMTYGVGVLNRFIHGVHPRDKLVIKDGIQWCADVFDKFVVNEQSVDVGDVVVRRYTPAKDGQSCSVIHIYCSEKDDIYFITDPGVKRCATLILDLSESRYIQDREIQTQMMFGDTEIKVSALDVTTGKCVKADIDFLNQ